MQDLYFKSEAETEKAIFDLIAKGVKFHTVGRTHIIVITK